MGDILVTVLLSVLGCWLVTGLFRRARSDVVMHRDDRATNWKAPAIGTRFAHCGRACVVVNDSYIDAEGCWQAGVGANYSDDDGRIRSFCLTPEQWDGLNPAGGGPGL